MATLYQRKRMVLKRGGFLDFEAREFARQYSMSEIRSLPYLVAMRRWRQLYVGNLKSRGYSDKGVATMISRLYKRLDLRTPWEMLRRFRKQSVDSGEYTPPKRKGSHHKETGVSKGDTQSQKQRRQKRLSELEKYERGRGR